MNIEQWAEREKEKVRNEPEYLAEGYFADITEQILAYMEKHNITRAELARRMDVSKPWITKVFRDDSNVTLLTLAKISKALTIDWMLKLIPMRDANTQIDSQYCRDSLPLGEHFSGTMPVEVQAVIPAGVIDSAVTFSSEENYFEFEKMEKKDDSIASQNNHTNKELIHSV